MQNDDEPMRSFFAGFMGRASVCLIDRLKWLPTSGDPPGLALNDFVLLVVRACTIPGLSSRKEPRNLTDRI